MQKLDYYAYYRSPDFDNFFNLSNKNQIIFRNNDLITFDQGHDVELSFFNESNRAIKTASEDQLKAYGDHSIPNFTLINKLQFHGRKTD